MPYRTIIIGAGIAGVATAWRLANRGVRDIVLIDREQPLSFTTAKSGENFRVYWPQPSLASLARRSIELMESLASETGEHFGMKFSGYDFVSEQPDRELFEAPAEFARAWRRETDPTMLRTNHPYLAESIRQVLTVTQAGAIEVQALGGLMLKLARGKGVRLVRAEVAGLESRGDGYGLRLNDGSEVRCERLVLAGGPFNGRLARQLGVELPIVNIMQRKIVVPDPLALIPPDMPFTIFADPQRLQWSDEEQALIESDPDYAWLGQVFPPGLHIKPEPGQRIKLGWAYNRTPEAPRWDPQPDDLFPDVVMRGASRFIPALSAYVENMPTPVVSFAGYYTRTEDNLPLIGPLGPKGLFTVGALAGYGTMAACAAGELCADWIMGEPQQAYAPYFHPDRFDNEQLMAEINAVAADGQL